MLILGRADVISLGRMVETRRFGKAGVKVLPMVGSDHYPIILDYFRHEVRGKKPFHFYEAWANVPECRDIVSSVWLPTGKGSGEGPLM